MNLTTLDWLLKAGCSANLSAKMCQTNVPDLLLVMAQIVLDGLRLGVPLTSGEIGEMVQDLHDFARQAKAMHCNIVAAQIGFAVEGLLEELE